MNTLARSSISWVAYPLSMVSVVVVHLTLLRMGLPLPVSTYVPLLMAIGAIVWLEFTHPQRPGWRPPAQEVRVDVLFMTMVQVALPPIVTIAFVLTFIPLVRALALPWFALWPHSWPLAAQVILVVLLSDFLRYWLHRAAHTSPLLWRLHAVHHSPKRLYWLNVGRFHPIEKALQMMLDTLPFMAFGVDAHVIALYYVLYATNGFFQHSNIRLRFGVLNYIVASADLHRWHHSQHVHESNNNYGNNLIVWDLLFGTFYLPRQRNVRRLGVLDANYPRSFLRQLMVPFSSAQQANHAARAGFTTSLMGLLVRVRAVYGRVRYELPFRLSARDPARAQERVLRDLLARNADTTFGREHGFGAIGSYEEFRHRVPVQTYDALEPHILAQARTGEPVLTREDPMFYARTSGTTGPSKYIPVTRTAVRSFLSQQRLFATMQIAACPEAFTGKALGMVGAAVEGHWERGIPVGSISGQVYRSLPGYIRSRYVVPAEVFDIPDYDLKYRTILRLALRERNLTWLGSANPSSFLQLLAVLNSEWDGLLRDLHRGEFGELGKLEAHVRAAVEPLLTADPARARELRERGVQGQVSYADVWPNIRMVTTWTGGSCGVALQALRAKLPVDTKIMELGFVATEFRGTIPFSLTSDSGLPAIRDHFFEFVERERWERNDPEYLTLDALQNGKQYYLIATTASGLYRYFINDIVEVTGWLGGTPLLRFVQKGKGVTNITGEKLYEAQAIRVMRDAAAALKIDVRFFMFLADTEAARYRLYMEYEGTTKPDAIAIEVDRRLRECNIEYDAKRASSRLGDLVVTALRPGTSDRYKRWCLEQGQREGQYKPLLLQYVAPTGFRFEEHVQGDSP